MEDKTDLLVRAAELYYEQKLNQIDIAKILNTSRPTVSRLLEEAKDAGIVEIIVHSPVRKNAKLSFDLRNTFGLREAIVVNGSYEYHKALRRCCEAASHFFNTIMENNKVIGISWGAAPQYLCDLIERKDYYNVHVVQMVGCLGTGNPNIDGIELALRISKRLGGTYSNIYAPIYVGSKTVHSYLIKEPQIEATLNQANHVDIILTGIGSFDSGTTLQQSGYFTDQDRMNIIGKGAVGHLLARPYDRNGSPIDMEPEGRYTIGAPLDAMHAAEWSVGISAAAFKAEAVLGAIRGKYINVLVADEALAVRMLELARGN
ncbi:Deoxyribonucleoside regulator [Caprobacter fermentans]|uniref:Deoxyribonucleoside regulator n=1 Tax=Caproicibacter fermentans TaxID=2576756 RepID=A0A6N8HZF4_9FIRM|nr:sugar-binding domain-containing protein [Caproicibacter fermentans]MVB10703.1 Deoxyribonucleoside regulator [Caproicibacter fermentans]OCN00467.1 hypothetical protein A7X67_16530 [Clostridium sp. W14A]QNK40866.1 hypothetical protein HCR03_00610 [Caproicibacter fermentans]